MDTSLSGMRVARVLDQVIADCGAAPQEIVLDNGPNLPLKKTLRCSKGTRSQAAGSSVTAYPKLSSRLTSRRSTCRRSRSSK